MSKYQVTYFETHIFRTVIEVEANSKLEARELARDKDVEIDFLMESDCIDSGTEDVELIGEGNDNE
jgi:hypothetical protein